MLGGEPLWDVPLRPAKFVPQSAETGNRESRRLPRITQGCAFQACALLRPDELQVRHRGAKRWVIPGSRLFTVFCDFTHAARNFARAAGPRAKAAPLQSGAGARFGWALFSFSKNHEGGCAAARD